MGVASVRRCCSVGGKRFLSRCCSEEGKVPVKVVPACRRCGEWSVHRPPRRRSRVIRVEVAPVLRHNGVWGGQRYGCKQLPRCIAEPEVAEELLQLVTLGAKGGHFRVETAADVRCRGDGAGRYAGRVRARGGRVVRGRWGAAHGCLRGGW